MKLNDKLKITLKFVQKEDITLIMILQWNWKIVTRSTVILEGEAENDSSTAKKVEH